MAHMVETMAWAGEVPWHGLGVKLDSDRLSAEMLSAAGLDWVVSLESIGATGANGESWALPEHFAIVRRNPDGSPKDPHGLGVVGRKFAPIQNSELFEFGDALSATGAAHWHTAGSLDGGRKVWALAQTAGSFEPRSGDKVLPFLLLHSAHDGSSSLKAKLTTVRVVCANTASLALRGAGAEVSIRHTLSASARMGEAARVLGLAELGFREQAETAKRLTELALSRAEFQMFAAQLLTGEDDGDKALEVVSKAEGRSETMYENKGNELTRLFERGKGNTGATAWDALNAVTEFIDHSRARMAKWGSLEQRAKGFESGQFGDGARKKERALRLLVRRG